MGIIFMVSKQIIMNTNKTTSSLQSRKEFQSVNFNIWHNVNGYYAKGSDMIGKKIISIRYFAKSAQANEHAEMEITGYFDVE